MMHKYPAKKLGGVCEINMGQSPASSTYNSNKNGLPFYQGKKDYGEKYPIPRVWCSDPIKIVETGDILISVRAPVGALNIAKEKSCIGRGLAGLRANKELDQDFLFNFLKLKEKDIAALGTGSTFTAISKKHLENIEIPLPPLAEQKKIVARLEKLLGKIKEAKRLREEAQSASAGLLPAELHRLLTPPHNKHTNKLALPVRSLARRRENVGMSSNKWEEKELGDLYEINRGGSPRPIKSYITSAPDGINWIKIGDAEEGLKYITKTREKIIPAGVKKTRLVYKGDLILSNSMSFGHPYILNIDGAIHDGWLLFRDKTDQVDKEYIYYVMSSNRIYDEFKRLASGAVVKNLNSNMVRKLKIPLPPIEEQKKIVARLDALSEKTKKLQEYQKSTASDFIALEQSVLSHAFSDKI